MSNNPSAKVIAITRDDGSVSVSQMQDVLAFLDRIINGSPLAGGNHDDDSFHELGRRVGQTPGQMYIGATLMETGSAARALRKRLIGV